MTTNPDHEERENYIRVGITEAGLDAGKFTEQLKAVRGAFASLFLR